MKTALLIISAIAFIAYLNDSRIYICIAVSMTTYLIYRIIKECFFDKESPK